MFVPTTDVRTGVRVLLTGEYWPGANPTYWMRSFERCGAIVRFHDDMKYWPRWQTVAGKVASRVLRRPMIAREWNEQLLRTTERFRPDLVFVSSGHLCDPRTLDELRSRGVPTVCKYYDPVWDATRGGFVNCVDRYDLLLTPRRWQADDFRRHGAREVLTIRFRCEPTVHRPVEVAQPARERYGSDVCLISSYRPRRAGMLSTLVAPPFDRSLRIWGSWEHAPANAPYLPYCMGQTVEEGEIVTVYSSCSVALHFVHREPTSSNRSERRGDEHNSRSFQIASCGSALMIAPRTSEHQAFFEEDKEVVLFDDGEELTDKVRYWMCPARADQRARIAAAGRERVLQQDYSYTPLARRVLRHFDLAAV